VAALALVMIGIYGVLSYSVAQRRQELGIRLALGAEKSSILRLVVGYGLTLTVVGVVIGLIFSVALSWIMASLLSGVLYKVSARDLTTFAVAPLAFLVIAVLASYLPARRATQVDPNEALRS
jgi:ABC-type antimicrobial peptide transport system permease subunit